MGYDIQGSLKPEGRGSWKLNIISDRLVTSLQRQRVQEQWHLFECKTILCRCIQSLFIFGPYLLGYRCQWVYYEIFPRVCLILNSQNNNLDNAVVAVLPSASQICAFFFTLRISISSIYSFSIQPTIVRSVITTRLYIPHLSSSKLSRDLHYVKW